MQKPNYVLRAYEGTMVPKNEDSFLANFAWGLFASSKMIATPFEIQFYDDYLIVYRDKRYYSKNLIRKEIDKFFYKDIKKIQYRTLTKEINIFGDTEYIRFNYNKDGSLSEKPTHHRLIKGGRGWFDTSQAPDVDFVFEIESHSPIKVIVDYH